jgi:hypothetical protein
MVLHRYPLAPTIRNYESTICEAVKAHFLGLDHIAAAGLIPVIEGAGRLLASQRGINSRSIREVFTALAPRAGYNPSGSSGVGPGLFP